MAETTYIDVIDTRTKTGPDTQRTVSLGMNHELRPGVLNLLGNLSHNSEITLDKANARKLIKWLQENIAGDFVEPRTPQNTTKHMKTPANKALESSFVSAVNAETVAAEYIAKQDKTFSRKDVLLIAEWVHFLATQN